MGSGTMPSPPPPSHDHEGGKGWRSLGSSQDQGIVSPDRVEFLVWERGSSAGALRPHPQLSRRQDSEEPPNKAEPSFHPTPHLLRRILLLSLISFMGSAEGLTWT